MQAVKDKLQDMNAMRKAKAEAKAEEKVINKINIILVNYGLTVMNMLRSDFI